MSNPEEEKIAREWIKGCIHFNVEKGKEIFVQNGVVESLANALLSHGTKKFKEGVLEGLRISVDTTRSTTFKGFTSMSEFRDKIASAIEEKMKEMK